MKLTSLNSFGASCGKVYFDYVEKQAVSTDIFCFQEVFCSQKKSPKISQKSHMYMFQELSKLLKGYVGFFDTRTIGLNLFKPVNFPAVQGLAIFVRKNFSILDYKSLIVVTKDPVVDHIAEGDFKVQVISLGKDSKKFSVINYHGISRPGNKQDTERRLLQSEQLKNIWNSVTGPKILCGDFNLELNTKSVKILESVSKNLIREFKIKNTRNQVSWDQYPGYKQRFADFTFVSKKIKVKNFEVPYNLASDHLPMVLDFDV